MNDAKAAYTSYISANGSVTEIMAYKLSNGKVVAIEHGTPVCVYKSEPEFLKSS